MGKQATKNAQQLAAETGRESLALGKELIAEGRPQRQAAGNYWTALLGGDQSALARATAPQFNAATQQFNVARNRAEGSMPLGGSRDRYLSNLNLAEAGQKTSILNSGINDAASRLAALGVGQTQTGIGSFGTTNQSSGNLANIGQGKAQSASGAGQGLGYLAAMV